MQKNTDSCQNINDGTPDNEDCRNLPDKTPTQMALKKYNPDIESIYKDDIIERIDILDPRRQETPVIETVDDNGLPVVYNYFEIDPKMLAKN